MVTIPASAYVEPLGLKSEAPSFSKKFLVFVIPRLKPRGFLRGGLKCIKFKVTYQKIIARSKRKHKTEEELPDDLKSYLEER